MKYIDKSGFFLSKLWKRNKKRGKAQQNTALYGLRDQGA